MHPYKLDIHNSVASVQIVIHNCVASVPVFIRTTSRGGDKHPQFSISWGIRTVWLIGVCTYQAIQKEKTNNQKKKFSFYTTTTLHQKGAQLGAKHLSKRNYQDNLLLLSQIYHFQQWRMLLQILAIYHRKQVGPLRSVLTYKYTLEARL